LNREEPILLGSQTGPDEVYVKIGSIKYTYELSRYWIGKAEAVWKHSAWRALQLVKKQGKLLNKETIS
jgi:hypothetical protein